MARHPSGPAAWVWPWSGDRPRRNQNDGDRHRGRARQRVCRQGRRPASFDPAPEAPVAAGRRGRVGARVQGVRAGRLRARRARHLRAAPAAAGPVLPGAGRPDAAQRRRARHPRADRRRPGRRPHRAHARPAPRRPARHDRPRRRRAARRAGGRDARPLPAHDPGPARRLQRSHARPSGARTCGPWPASSTATPIRYRPGSTAWGSAWSAEQGARPHDDRRARPPHRRPSASTCTCRSARRGATTARSRRGPTATTSSARTSTRAAATSSAPSRRACQPPPASSSAGARRRWWRRPSWSRSSTPCPGRPAARSPSSATPTPSPLSWSRRTRPAASTGSASGCSRWSTTCCTRLGRTHDPANVRRAVTLVRAAGDPHVQPRPHLRRGGETVDDWARTLDARPRPRASARQRLRPDRRAGDAAGRRPAPASRRRRPGREVPGRGRAAGGGGPALVRDLELGPARARVPPQPALLVDGRVPGVRVRRALAPGRAPVLERADPRALHRGDRRRPVARGRRRAARRRTSGGSRRSSSRSAPEVACRPRPCPSTTSATWWTVEGDRAVLTVRGRLLANEVALRLRLSPGRSRPASGEDCTSGCETSRAMTFHPSVQEWDADLLAGDPLGFPGYDERRRALAKTGEAVTTGRTEHYAYIEGCFEVLGGTMGAAVGERVVRAYDRARDLRPPRGRAPPGRRRPAAGGHGRPRPARPHRVGGQPPRPSRAAVACGLRLAHHRRGLRLLRLARRPARRGRARRDRVRRAPGGRGGTGRAAAAGLAHRRGGVRRGPARRPAAGGGHGPGGSTLPSG